MLKKVASFVALSLFATLLFAGVVSAQAPSPATSAATPAAPPAAAPSKHAAPPKLILQITVDQLRGDLPFRYMDRFTKGGFRRFLDRGLWYEAARHDHAYLETIVGHSTLATGAWPSRHGMVANSWIDPATGKEVQDIEDPRYPVLPMGTDAASMKGVSPMSILTTTFSDELRITTAGRAKVFSVSIKDRGAVPMAGHAGKAFWYYDQSGCFVTSTFYYSAYPQWVTDWCAGKPADAYANTKWELLEEKSKYLFRDVTNVYPAGTPPEANMAMLASMGFGRTFPHSLGSGTALYRNLTIAPGGDELTAAFAKELLRRESLGKDEIPDYLAVSFSVTDYIGHWFSPTSLESEDNLLRLDRTIQSLLDYVDAEVGLQNTVVVLSADHGGPEYPEYLATLGINTGRIAKADIDNASSSTLAAKFSARLKGRETIASSFFEPYLDFADATLARHALDSDAVEREIARAIMEIPGIALAVTTAQLTSGEAPGDEELMARLRHNYNRQRSGNLHIVALPQWQIDSSSSAPILLQHGSVWAYDSFVPVAFLIPHATPSVISRPVSTTSVAPTLSVLVKTKFPSGNVGEPLVEVLGGGSGN